MNLNIDVSYKIGDKVKIIPLSEFGRIEAIRVSKGAIMYEIRYILNGEIKQEYFYADELKRPQNI